MLIRAEQPADRRAVYRIHCEAFETPAEARLVDALREAAAPIVSLVAEWEGVVAGHILFTPVTLTKRSELRIMGLAPLAVAADHRRQGIGAELVRAGLEQCRELGYGAAVVLGSPDYYGRFGFKTSTGYGMISQYDVPAEAFMAIELQPGYLRGAAGTIQYHAAFAEL